jgi:hypothetical protein
VGLFHQAYAGQGGDGHRPHVDPVRRSQISGR